MAYWGRSLEDAGAANNTSSFCWCDLFVDDNAFAATAFWGRSSEDASAAENVSNCLCWFGLLAQEDAGSTFY
eukprot:scaffold176425_cov17-Tisochrysis_lutea.AAC.1